MSDKLNVTPTGCPGPIPGTRVWRCDGVNCVYGPYFFDSCKQAIADRGYVLRISSDLVEEAAEAAELHRQTVQGQLEQTQRELADEAKAHKQTAATLRKEVELTQSEADEFANLYYTATLKHERANAIAVTLHGQSEAQCAHCSELLQEIAELRDERDYYKSLCSAQDTLVEREVDVETTNDTGDIDTRGGVGDNGDSVLDTGAADGTVSE